MQFQNFALPFAHRKAPCCRRMKLRSVLRDFLIYKASSQFSMFQEAACVHSAVVSQANITSPRINNKEINERGLLVCIIIENSSTGPPCHVL